MSWYDILRDFGIIAFLGSACVGVLIWAIKQICFTKQGVQALLRAQLIADYDKYSDMGYAPIHARENFENCYQKYHKLGKNGVMDDIHKKLLQLPTEPHEHKEDE